MMTSSSAICAQLSTEPEKPLILLLQGPVGPFFHELSRQLVERGFGVLKINFNGGDLFFSNPANVYNFRGPPSEWSACLQVLFAHMRPAAIVLFGDGRPYHVEALRIAEEHGVTVLCLEEGYIRPDYITCERSGNNARSPLMDATAAKHDVADSAQATTMKNSFGEMASYAALYSIAEAVFWVPFRGNMRHRDRPIARECARWALNLVRKLAFYRHNRAILHNISNQVLRDYYVVALQVHDDVNLTRNGNGWTMERLIDEVTESFAAHAPAQTVLLFKVHPLDRGHRPYRKLVAKAARASGCDKRIQIADDCPIGPMIRNSNGLITVNSTSGLIALRHQKPLLVLGNAVYSTASLKTLPSTSTDLHSFWRWATVAREQNVDAFLDRMLRESLVNGSFYLAAAREATCNAVAERIQQEITSASVSRLLELIHEPANPNGEPERERLAG